MSEENELTEKGLLLRIAKELKTIREGMQKVLYAINDAESEVPEKMRRFIMYFHDAHDVMNMYQERGLPVPEWLNREVERCSDRYRQLLNDLHLDGGTFDKVRREMASDPENRYDHTRLLTKSKESSDDQTRPG